MKIKPFVFSVITVLLCSAQLAIAHGSGHGGSPISEEQAISVASESIAMIVDQQVEIENSKLDASWNSIPAGDKAIYKKERGYYIVSVNNKTQEKTLFVLLSDQGEFYNANYSGKFTGVPK